MLVYMREMSNQERLLVVCLFYLGVALYFGAEYVYRRERELGSLADGTPVTGGRLKDGTFYRSVVASGNACNTLTRKLSSVYLRGSTFERFINNWIIQLVSSAK